MKQLTYQTLKEMNYDGYLLEKAPERVLQFGEGNFLRAFVEDFIDQMNERVGFNSKVVACQPNSKNPQSSDRINAQEGLYTLILRGFQDGQKVSRKRIISCISRCLNTHRDYDALMACTENPELRFIVCNTTEAGIVYDPACGAADRPPVSYPAKLTQFLYRRFQTFGTVPGKGFIILACELIDDNGKELKKCVLRHASDWELGEDFIRWIENENVFCSTLVDRIVTGYPRSEAESLCTELGYEDNIIDTGETFGIWVIEGPKWLKEELPVEKAGLPVLICSDHKPYKQRKVRILNGAHTSMVPGAFLAGKDIVRDCMEDPVISRFLHDAIQEEIIPTLSLPREELQSFAASVEERFNNPFIDHALLSITLNCTSKWKARVLPSLKGYVDKFGTLPRRLTASFAFYLAFYRGVRLEEDGMIGLRGEEEYRISDDRSVLEFFDAHKEDSAAEFTHAVCTQTAFWGEDLSQLPGFESEVTALLEKLQSVGTYEVMKEL